jgi:exopolyphosphatase/guanosine-5'-triphosphate,3'-diphosphate pyrophosphatase
VASRSFPVGTIRMLKGKVKSSVWKSLDAWIEKNFKKNNSYITFATGGNINKIHKILGKKSNEPIPLKEFTELHNDLAKLSVKKRVSEFKLKPDRADVIVPAFEIYEYIFSRINTEEVYVPKIGLSDGMIYNLYRKHSRKKR